MRSSAHYHEKGDYIRFNPVRKDLVRLPDAWPWQGVWVHTMSPSELPAGRITGTE